jgi:glutamyl-tRNA reductase
VKYLIVSYTHKNTDIKTREKLACNNENRLIELYEGIISLPKVKESLILSTCNRVEIVLSVTSHSGVEDSIRNTLCTLTSVSKEEIEQKGRVYKNEDAIYHLFCVGSSLDSLVVGETQITGQLKEAFRFSFDRGYSGQSITRAMIHTFKCSAGVRSSVDISKNPVSIASVAVAKAKEIYGGNLGGYTGVIVGAGAMGELVAKHLASAGANIVILNRSLEKAHSLAQKIEDVNVIVEPISRLKDMVNHYRLLFTATNSTSPIIDKDLIEEVSFERNWFDIAVPRDIQESNYKNINVYSVDDLKETVDQNIQDREHSAKEATVIVDEYMRKFYKWLHTLNIDPIIKQMRENAKFAAREEIERSILKGYIKKEHEEIISKILHGAFNSFLHSPTANLKNIADTPQADTIVQSLQLIFDINKDEEKMINTPKCDYLIEKDILKKDTE